jgi:Spy/CpxP family protein refolding chaperone
MKTSKLRWTLLLLAAGTVAMAQQPPPGQQGPPDQQGPPPGQQGPAGQWKPVTPPGGRGGGRGALPPGGGYEQRLLPGPHGKWWDNPQIADQVGLSADQKKKMDDIFQQHRLKLIDLNATVQREETVMEPLVAADQPDEAKIVAQIDKVAQARAELEKANARMLLAIRRVLTPEQYQKLQTASRAGGPGQPAAGGQQAPPPAQKKR